MSKPITTEGMIAELLPCDIATAEATAIAGADALFPAELALINCAVPKRQVEFATARQCARRALAQLDVPPVPILKGASREPLWPDGIVGSITHCAGYHAAAVGRTTRFCSIGIDAEPDEPLPDGVLDHVSLPAERAQLIRGQEPCFDRLLFSAKEAIYKAWFPLSYRWLGFEQALITLHADGTFDVKMLVDGPFAGLRGRWLARDGLILTAIALPRAATWRRAGDARVRVQSLTSGVALADPKSRGRSNWLSTSWLSTRRPTRRDGMT